jgi:hypothetical protein
LRFHVDFEFIIALNDKPIVCKATEMAKHMSIKSMKTKINLESQVGFILLFACFCLIINEMLSGTQRTLFSLGLIPTYIIAIFMILNKELHNAN